MHRGNSNAVAASRVALVLAALGLALGCASIGPVSQPAPPVAPNLGPMIRPAPLHQGATIRFVAPAGPLDRERMSLAKTRLEQRGYRVQMSEDPYRRRRGL